VTARLARYAGTFRGFSPEARRFLVATLVLGAAGSLWWIDFNLYLAAVGLERAGIGLIATVSSIAATLVALPASALSDRIGRRLVMALGAGVALAGVLGLQASAAVPVLTGCAVLFAVGWSAMGVVQGPWMTEHSEPGHRSELFAVQFALANGTQIGAAIIGGLAAQAVAAAGGLDPAGPATYRVILAIMAVLGAVGLLIVLRLDDDRPSVTERRELLAVGEPAAFPARRAARRGRWAGRFGIAISDRATFAKLVLPGYLISIGAGQIIPFLNLFIQRKFDLELAALNAAFALTSLGTVAAILVQPAIARRLGRMPSVIAVQAASIPFLVVLGFSPILWTVVAAMAVRNSLMNAGNPIFTAFALDHVAPAERATLSAAQSLLWSAGWVIAGPWYSVLQATLGFEAGYAVNFATIIILYSVATCLYWHWFRAAEPVRGRTG
jgi:MFS family permease